MTGPHHYRNWYRAIDKHGVMHLALPTAVLGEFLCGNPPLGNLPTDEATEPYWPGALTRREYRRVCPVCNDRAAHLFT